MRKEKGKRTLIFFFFSFFFHLRMTKTLGPAHVQKLERALPRRPATGPAAAALARVVGRRQLLVRHCPAAARGKNKENQKIIDKKIGN